MEARITWTHSSNGQVTEFGNTPFRLLERRTLDCQFGKQYYKDKPRRSSRAMVQGTRKLGCPAHIEIKVYEVFPEYSISESVLTQNSKRALRILKEDKMTRLKTALSMKDNVKSVKKYFVSLPTSEAHNKTHPTGAIAGAAQKIHPLLSQKIESLVKEGTTNARTVQRVLKEYVHESTRPNLPCETDRSYYPTIADINNHIYKSKTALQLSKFDQHNLHLKIEEWKQERTDLKHFFCPLSLTKMIKIRLKNLSILLSLFCGCIKKSGRRNYLADTVMK